MNETRRYNREDEPLPVHYVGYLEPVGNFTHMAGLVWQDAQAGKANVVLIGAGKISEIFDKVQNREVDYGIIPIENSTDGPVKDSFVPVADSDLWIKGEVVVPVSLSLYMRPGITPTEIWSKDTALRQSSKWISDHYPGIPQTAYKSTGAAVFEAIRNPKIAIAAIGSKISASAQGLLPEEYIQIDGLENNPANATRFVVVGKKQEIIPLEPSVKSSFVMTIHDRPGGLVEVLRILEEHSVNLSQIHSFRPNGNSNEMVSFFVTVNGHAWNHPVADALQRVKEHAHIRMKGSYRRAEYSPPSTGQKLVITNDIAEDIGAAELTNGTVLLPNETIIVFALHDRIGALHNAIRLFSDRGLNLTRIGSRPSPRGYLDEYVFLLGVQGDKNQVHDSLKELEKESVQMELVRNGN